MNNYHSLDLDKVKEKVSEYASISDAKSFILEEEVSFNPLVIKKNLKETSEALALLNRNIYLSFDGIENVEDILAKAEKGIILMPSEIYKVLALHNHSERLKKIFDNLKEELLIKDYSDSITLNHKTFKIIDEAIDNNGEVKKDATPELLNIYNNIEKLDKDLFIKATSFINQHKSSLQEPSSYIRNGRICFLIKNSDKNKYQGYAYGNSASGLASYIEPGQFVELNNRRLALDEEKEQEISRILSYLTYLISDIADDYRHNYDSLVKLNVIFAKAMYGQHKNGILAEVNDTRYFDLKDVCHPLIDTKKVIANNYRLYAPYQGIVISGSNTGGKTVGLKTIGLSVLMSYLGIPIIASSASIPIYDQIFVDIDDNQSIIDSLSTFSAHITNINNILNNADYDSLILIDELISGTDPKEAQAISLAIIEKIKELGSIFIITTHFDDIKNYCYKDCNILLSSVGFNLDTLLPTYKYLEDSVGSSNAIDIASRFFDDKKLIEKSKQFLLENQSKEDELLNKLSHQISENESLKHNLLLQENEFKTKNEELSKEIAKLNTEKETIIKNYKQKLNEELEQIKEQALEKLENLKDKNDFQTIREIEELKDDSLEEEKDEELAVGDNVRIGDNEQIGFIEELNDNQVTVNLGGLKVKTNLSKLKRMPKTIKKEKYQEKRRIARVPSEINLVGERVEDALVKMEEYLDKAYGAQMTNVKVIHGIGTGALRNAIRERLKRIKFVKEFKNGDFYDGGSAVTMVEFKR